MMKKSIQIQLLTYYRDIKCKIAKKLHNQASSTRTETLKGQTILRALDLRPVPILSWPAYADEKRIGPTDQGVLLPTK